MKNEKALREKKNESKSTIVCFSVCGEFICAGNVCVLAAMSDSIFFCQDPDLLANVSLSVSRPQRVIGGL